VNALLNATQKLYFPEQKTLYFIQEITHFFSWQKSRNLIP
jgi:hypothetical protein